jgi:NADPH:quinone reductase-like Zn-dependent oxidoreductase
MSPPASAEALVVRVDSNNTPKLVKDVLPVPKPGPRQLLVKVSHVAQNPTDGEAQPPTSALAGAGLTHRAPAAVQSFDVNAFGDGTILGCDFVGVVVETGPDVTRITKGTTIAGLIWGGMYAPYISELLLSYGAKC